MFILMELFILRCMNWIVIHAISKGKSSNAMQRIAMLRDLTVMACGARD